MQLGIYSIFRRFILCEIDISSLVCDYKIIAILFLVHFSSSNESRAFGYHTGTYMQTGTQHANPQTNFCATFSFQKFNIVTSTYLLYKWLRC